MAKSKNDFKWGKTTVYLYDENMLSSSRQYILNQPSANFFMKTSYKTYGKAFTYLKCQRSLRQFFSLNCYLKQFLLKFESDPLTRS